MEAPENLTANKKPARRRAATKPPAAPEPRREREPSADAAIHPNPSATDAGAQLAAPPQTLHTQSSRLFNRELSWLEFNRRVLEEAQDASAPPLERLKFLSIFCTNLDEFFMIRVSGLRQSAEEQASGETGDRRSPDGLLPEAQLALISERLRPMLASHAACLRDEVMPALGRAGISIVEHAGLSDEERVIVDRYFIESVFPVLTPQAVDPSHPFPYISNRSLNLGVMVEPIEADAEDEPRFARIKVPPIVPRLVAVGDAGGEGVKFVLLEDLIAANASALFPGVRTRRAYAFRVTRDADIELHEDEADDLLRLMERELRQRRFGDAVRLEVETAMPGSMVEYLTESLSLASADVYKVEGWLNIPDLMRLYELDRPDLKDRPLASAATVGTPGALSPLAGFETDEDFFAAVRRADQFVHHPFQTFASVTDFISRAARDPDVLAIKMTLYRAGSKSPIVQALIDASERGKQVAVIVELKARFDEENNIEWARRMDNSGIHVVYGMLGLKTHSKIALVVRREGTRLRRYLHIGSGNYNPATARFYTDVGLFTANEEAGADATELFNSLTGYSQQSDYRRLLIAPVSMREGMDALIENEIAHALAGRDAGVIVKINSLTDTELIHLLYRASQAGVRIDLVVRGICMLRPGVKGLSENIRVRSIVGRFLEHSRIFYFLDGGRERVFIGSADWMRRNLDRRVELATPIDDPTIKRHLVDDVLGTYLRDNTKARRLQPDGTYERVPAAREGEPRVDSQQHLAELYRLSDLAA